MSSHPSLRVLLSNDDGIFAPGILAMRQALEAAGHKVFTCAPDRPRSASGHALTMHKPLRLREVTMGDGVSGWACSGTPADCATLGLLEVAKEGVDVVVSGINHGPNLGWDVTYSGTVAAAKEAAIYGYPAIAVSVASYEEQIHWGPVADYVARTLAPAVRAHGLPVATLLNVNAPSLPQDEIKGARLTVQGDRQYADRMEKRLDPGGRPYYWLGGRLHDKETAPGTDVRAVGEGYISVTPIQLDMTAHALLRDLKRWQIEQ